MIYTVEISAQAETDLREIYEYIAFELQAPENAAGQLERLERCIVDLNQIWGGYNYPCDVWRPRYTKPVR